jgi:hypothetical protein
MESYDLRDARHDSCADPAGQILPDTAMFAVAEEAIREPEELDICWIAADDAGNAGADM